MRKRKKSVSIKSKENRCSLYKAVDEYGNTIDFLVKNHKDMQAAKAFFKKSIDGICRLENMLIGIIFSNLFKLKSINGNKKASDKIKINRFKDINI